MTVKLFIVFTLFIGKAIFSIPFKITDLKPEYEDEELRELWDSIDDIKNPQFEDYLKIQNYLTNAYRPYLDVVFDHIRLVGKEKFIKRKYNYNFRLLQGIQLVNFESNSLPTYKIENLGVPISDKSKCIVLYASYNPDFRSENMKYYQKMYKIIKELRKMGYRGHVLYRVGGYPASEFGGLRFTHIPYSFKILSLIEASHMGYENVLWLDCAVHPTNNLDLVFRKIRESGVYLLYSGINLDYDYGTPYGILPDKTVESWGIKLVDLKNIKHIVAGIVGVSFKSDVGHRFINEWYRLTALTLPAMSLYPEEFLISMAAYSSATAPTGHIGNYIDTKVNIPNQPLNKCIKPFWLDRGGKP
jgi:hypothetical protein